MRVCKQKHCLSFSGFAREGKSLATGTPQWKAYSMFVTELPRIPTVTVDVFRFKNRSGNYVFYQWAVAPFEGAYYAPKAGGCLPGMDMVFFDARTDKIGQNMDVPLTNFRWQKRVAEGKLDGLPAILRVPDKEGVAK